MSESTFNKWIEDYIGRLTWSPETTDYEKTLVLGNIRTMAHTARFATLMEAEDIVCSEHGCTDNIRQLRDADQT